MEVKIKTQRYVVDQFKGNLLNPRSAYTIEPPLNEH